MAKQRATLTHSLDWYVPQHIKDLLKTKEGEKMVRKEYTRLRDISQKRLKRLRAAGFNKTDIYRKNVHHYKKLKDIKSKNELAQRLSDLSRFIESKRSTVRGMRDIRYKQLESLHETGYDFVTEHNLEQFGDYMEEYRDQLLDYEYDSGEAADAYRVAEKHKIDPEKVKANFEFWLENADIIDNLKVTGKSNIGSIKRRVAAYKKKQRKKK